MNRRLLHGVIKDQQTLFWYNQNVFEDAIVCKDYIKTKNTDKI